MYKISVLLADDNEAMLRTIWQFLEQEFRVVAAVADSACVLRTAEQFAVDVIVLDISMPGIDGIEVARRLREQGCRSAIVFLTVHRASRMVKAALESGAQGYVIKSSAGEDLIPAIYAASKSEEFVSPAIEGSQSRTQ
jgi:DNA-binding NarL/FixJ family response regulator